MIEIKILGDTPAEIISALADVTEQFNSLAAVTEQTTTPAPANLQNFSVAEITAHLESQLPGTKVVLQSTDEEKDEAPPAPKATRKKKTKTKPKPKPAEDEDEEEEDETADETVDETANETEEETEATEDLAAVKKEAVSKLFDLFQQGGDHETAVRKVLANFKVERFAELPEDRALELRDIVRDME